MSTLSVAFRATDHTKSAFSSFLKEQALVASALLGGKKLAAAYGTSLAALGKSALKAGSSLLGITSSFIPWKFFLGLITRIVARAALFTAALFAIKRAGQGFLSAVVEKKSFQGMGLAFRQASDQAGMLAENVGRLAAEMPGLGSSFDLVALPLKGFAELSAIGNAGLERFIASAKFLKQIASGGAGIDEALEFGRAMEQSENRLQGALEDIAFGIEKTSSETKTIVQEFTVWEKIVRSIKSSLEAEQRGGLVEAFDLLTGGGEAGSQFKAFLAEQREIAGGFGDVATELSAQFLKLQQDERDLLQAFFDGMVTRKDELNDIATIFENLEAGLAGTFDGEQIQTLLSLLPDLMDKWTEKIEENQAAVFDWAGSITGAFGDVHSAASSAISAIIQDEANSGAAAAVFAADIIRALSSVAKQKAMFELAEGFAALSNPVTAPLAAGHFKAAALYGLVSLGASAAAAAVEGPSGSGSSGSEPTLGRRREEQQAAINQTEAGPSRSINITIQNAYGSFTTEDADRIAERIGGRVRDRRIFT